jgi:hypothetical protein
VVILEMGGSLQFPPGLALNLYPPNLNLPGS